MRHFVNKYFRRMGKRIESISKEIMDSIARYSWPGNIRSTASAALKRFGGVCAFED